MPLVSKLIFLIFLYILMHSFLVGATTEPIEGDSLYYHIPIARSIASGDFLFPDYGNVSHMYFPGATEALLSIFLTLHIPPNLFNVFGIASLFAACYFLAKQTSFGRNYSILFASTICTLQVVIRWALAQTVDIWLGVFFITSLSLLQHPKKSWRYFLLLGVTLGMLIGTKYSGPLFAIGLLLVYGKRLLGYLRVHTVLLATAAISILGLFWYIRNWMATDNPFYPLDTALFPGLVGNEILSTPVWKTLMLYPSSMLNAFVGEYIVWSITVCAMLLFLLQQTLVGKKQLSKQISAFVCVGIFNLLVFTLLPSGDSYQLHVSQFRFSYPAFIPLILCVFLLAKKYKKLDILALLTVTNVVVLTSLSYRPKLLFIWLFAIFLVFNQKFYEFLSRNKKL